MPINKTMKKPVKKLVKKPAKKPVKKTKKVPKKAPASKAKIKSAVKTNSKKKARQKTKTVTIKEIVKKKQKTTYKKDMLPVSPRIKTSVSLPIPHLAGINRETIEKPKFKSGNVKITPKIQEEMPFNINTYVFYPGDGLGYIDSLEKRELGGKTVLYYKIEFKTQRMTARIPVKKAKMLKLRKVIGKTLAQKVLNTLSIVTPPSLLSWKDRLTVYQETNKKGNAIEMAAMVASLYLRKQQKSLSFQERQYFEFALEAVTGEISVAFAIEETNARVKVNAALSILVDTFNKEQK